MSLFISYSTQEHEITGSVFQSLLAVGRDCFWAAIPGSIPYGIPDYWVFLENKIRESESVILIASKASLSSKNVIREVQLAQKYNKRIIPFYYGIRPEQLTPLLGNVQAVNGANARAVQAALAQIASESEEHPLVAAGLVLLAGLIIWLAVSGD